MFRKVLFCFALLVVARPAAANEARVCYLETGDVGIAACTRAIQTKSGKPAINYNNRGNAYQRKGDYDLAIADYSEAMRLDPKYSTPYFNRGLAYYKKNDPDRAISDYSDALRLNPKYAAASYNRGLAYAKRGDPDRALADYNEAIRLDPKYVAVYYDRGLLYQNKGDLDRAFADYSESIRLDPKYSYAYNNRGNIFRRRGDLDRAMTDYGEAIRADPKNAVAYYNRGLGYAKKNDMDRAFADFNEAIRINPKYASAYLDRGLAYSRKGDSDRAIADYNEAIRVDPKFALAYNNRGSVLRSKGETDRALADFNEAIRINAKFARAYTNRGLLHEKAGEIAKARADFNSALELPQDDDDKWPQSTARERLAGLSSPPASGDTAKAKPAEKVATAVVTPVAPASNDRRIALVIGNSGYENVAVLPNPERDATLVAETLKRIGFESVTLLSNLRKEALVNALRAFAARAESADWAVVYYAGHGMEVGGTNYLIPVDARVAVDRDIGFEAVALDQVLNAAERAKKLRLVILDACRDNPFVKQMRRTMTVASRSVTGGLAAVEPEAGTLVAYAAKDGETALDGDGANSPFARALVKNLQVPGLEVRRLFDVVRDDVIDSTNRKQKPFTYGSISGRQDFYFVASR
jgi:tetratricopeptide (TPR) repeat protein